MVRSKIVLVLGLMATVTFMPTMGQAETQLKALSSMRTNLDYTQAFLKLFINRANELSGGELKITLIGGPEVTPARKAAGALERGVFDILYGPAGYYAGSVPEAMAIHGSTVGPDVLRKNGGFALLDKIWGERIKAKILAWGISETKYNLFFKDKPKVTADALDLSGMKVRSSPTYKPLLLSLGATPVSIPFSDFYTSLNRGLVSGSGWPAVGLARTGVGKLMKYKVEPSFFRSNHLIIINKAKWDSLSDKAKKALQTAALEYETGSIAYLNNVQKAENEKLKKLGLETITLKGKARAAYDEGGRKALWKIVDERSKNAAQLRKLLDVKK